MSGSTSSRLERSVLKLPTSFGHVSSWHELTDQGSRWPSAAHGDFEITIIESGELRYHVGLTEHVVEAGRAIVVPTDIEHTTSIGPGAVARAIHIEHTYVAEVAELVQPSLGFVSGVTVIAASAALSSLTQLVFEEARRRDPGCRIVSDALIEAIVVEMLRAAGKTALQPTFGRDRRVARAIELIESSYGESLGVADLARVALMSRYHFSRAFRAHTGQSPYQYLVDVRLAHAAAMLSRGHATVTEAAFSVGFGDLSRFGALFRRRFGVAPSAYRQARARIS